MKYQSVYEVTDIDQISVSVDGVVSCTDCAVTVVEYQPSIAELTPEENSELKVWIFTILMIAYLAGKSTRFMIGMIRQSVGQRG